MCVCTKTYTVATQVFPPQQADRLTWWPIKSKVQQPLVGFMVTFDINHWCTGSAVRFCPQDSSDHSLTLLTKTGLYINTSLGGHLLDMRLLLPEGEKRSSSSNTAGGLFNSVLQSVSSKRAKTCKWAFFSEEREKIVLTLESPLFLFITGVRGPVIFIGHTADILISAVYFWLWCQPLQFSSQNKRLWHVRMVRAVFTVPSLYPICYPKRLLKCERLEWKL